MTPYSAFTAYRCRHCSEPCINHRETPEASTSQCRSCWRLPSLDDAPAGDDLLDDADHAPRTDRREVRR